MNRNRALASIAMIVMACILFFMPGCQRSRAEAGKEHVVYVAGYVETVLNGGILDIPCYWMNGARTDLSVLDPSKSGFANSIYISENDVYVAGETRNGSHDIPCFWKNDVRTDLDSSSGGYASSICISGNDVYIAGGATEINSGTMVPCFWKNEMRTDLSVMDKLKWSRATGIFVSGSDVYVAGYTTDSTDVRLPCYWKNGVRTDLDSSYSGSANSIYVSGDDVYVAGNTKYDSEFPRWPRFPTVPCRWKNGTRTDLSVLNARMAGWATSIHVSENVVYVAGVTDSVPCYWKNWVRIDLSLGDVDYGEGRSIYVSGEDIYVAGETLTNSRGLTGPCYWKNKERIDLRVMDWPSSGQANSIFVTSK